MLVHGIDGNTRPQILKYSQPTFISQELPFEYKPSKIVGEHASEETISEVAVELLDYFMGNARTIGPETPSIMFFAYDFGGIVVKQVLQRQFLLLPTIKANL